jgi:benzoyl-CoA reductase/2-hydroxyglutaryl-CoA dehydratase subunit BcrC/BadD/HgdB
MEDVFDPRIRGIFNRLCSGSWEDLEAVVIPRTSEQEHKLYLYLREMARLREAEIPKLYLYNLLHTRTPEAFSYGLEQTRRMAHEFGASEDGLRAAIAESNRARACVHEIVQFRREGMIEGSTARGLIHGFYTSDRNTFAERIPAQLKTMDQRVAADRPRLLIEGAPLRDDALHRAIEQSGGYVVAEDDWMGSRAAGETNVREDTDPLTAIFEKYFYDEVSPRLPSAEVRDEWFRGEVARGGVDGVVFHLPLEDDVFGWDYPRQLAYLSSRNIPSLLVRDGAAPLQTFVRSLQ